MSNEFSIEYSDIIRVYQNKVSDLINQVVAAEAKVVASERIMQDMSAKIEELQGQQKPKKPVSKKIDAVTDFSN